MLIASTDLVGSVMGSIMVGLIMGVSSTYCLSCVIMGICSGIVS